MGVWIAVGAGFLAVLHAIGGKLRFIAYIPRSGWLSFAGGVSVAYVFVHLLPELAAGADVVERRAEELVAAEHLLWLVGLAGMVLFYGVELASRASRGHQRGAEETTVGVYRLSIASYAVYNSIVAYLLHARADEGFAPLAVFVVAMAFHFVVNDFALRDHHKRRYEKSGRWILVAAIGAGAVGGATFEVSPLVIELARAAIAGGVILNVLKEELPREAESSFPAFVGGTSVYALLLLAL